MAVKKKAQKKAKQEAQCSTRLNLTIKLHDKQCVAFTTPATEVLYGGAAGGGKSFLMRAAAISWCTEIPGLQIYLFRRLLPDLIKNHMEGPKGFRALLSSWVNAGLVKIVEDEIRFLFNGSKIFLCHCQDDADRFKYQGSEMHVLLMDELTSFSECIYTFLRSRVRMSGVKLPDKYIGIFPRILCSSNPGGEGHEWVKRYWIDPVPPMEMQQQISTEGGMLRQFIPAKLDDNPSLLDDDPHYEDKLSGLGSPAMVKAYRDGDWNVIAGAYYPEFSNHHILKPFKIPKHWTRVRGFDWGSYDPFCVQWWAVASEDFEIPGGKGQIIPRESLICYREWYGADNKRRGLKYTIEQIATGIQEREVVGERIDYSVAGKDVFDIKGGPSFSERFIKRGIVFRKASTSRLQGWDEVRKRLVGQMDAPMLYVFDTCRDLIRTFPVLQHDDKKQEDMAKGDDHCLDTCRYICMSRPWAAEKPEEKHLSYPATITLDELVELEKRKTRKWRRR